MRRLMTKVSLLGFACALLLPNGVRAAPGNPDLKETQYIGTYFTLTTLAVDNFSELQSTYNANTGGIAWRTEIFGIIRLWDSLLIYAEKTEPPLSMVDTHDDLTAGLHLLIDAGDLFEQSIDQANPALVEEGNPILQAGLDRLTVGATRIESYLRGDTTELLTPTPRATRRAIPTPAPPPTSSPPQPTAVRATPAPLGVALAIPDWTIQVTDAVVLPDLSGARIGFVAVTLSVTNTSSGDRKFGRPDNSFLITSSDGRDYEDDLFASAQARGVTGEWVGNFAAGKTYPVTVVFSIPKADVQVYPDDPSGWVMSYIDASGQSYEFELGI